MALAKEDGVTNGRKVFIEGQFNFKDKSVLKSEIKSFFISSTLATEIVEGNTPTQYDIADIKFTVDGDIIVAQVDVEGLDAKIEAEVKKYVGDIEKTLSDLDKKVESKVEKVEGKSLISDEEIERLSKVDNYNDTEVKKSIKDLDDNKVDKEPGKSLVSDTEIARLKDVHNYDDAQVKKDITDLKNNKVDKRDGYSLVSDAEKQTWNGKSDFSGDYNDLENKPDPSSFGTKVEANPSVTEESPVLGSLKVGEISYRVPQGGSGGGDVTSVNGKVGVVVLNAKDVKALPDDTELFSGDYNDLENKPKLFDGNYNNLINKPTIPSSLSELESDADHRTVTDEQIDKWNQGGDGKVISVNGKDGIVELDADDVRAVKLAEEGEVIDLPTVSFGTNIPKYALDGMNDVLDKIYNKITEIGNPLIIGFSTDQHLNSSNPKIENDVSIGLNVLSNITRKIPFNICVLGGDASSSTSALEVQKDVLKVSSLMSDANCPLFHISGNHDTYQQYPFSMEQAFGSHRTDTLLRYDVKFSEYANTTNYYLDDSINKIRYIMVDSYPRNGYSLSNINEFIRYALSDITDGYEAIVISHFPLNSTLPKNDEHTLWNNAISCQDVLNEYADKIICCICGHVHNNLNVIKDGILYISTTCAGRYELNDGSTRPYDALTSTAFDIFVVDRNYKKLYAIRYGNGSDREMEYKTQPTVDNLIANSIDSEGNIYNDVGYKLGYRLNSNGTEASYSNCGVTGFIELSVGDTIILENCKLSSTGMACDYIAAYKEDFTKIISKYATKWIDGSTSTFAATCETDSNGYITKLTITNCAGMKYIRISSNGIDENAIIYKEI